MGFGQVLSGVKEVERREDKSRVEGVGSVGDGRGLRLPDR